MWVWLPLASTHPDGSAMPPFTICDISDTEPSPGEGSTGTTSPRVTVMAVPLPTVVRAVAQKSTFSLFLTPRPTVHSVAGSAEAPASCPGSNPQLYATEVKDPGSCRPSDQRGPGLSVCCGKGRGVEGRTEVDLGDQDVRHWRWRAGSPDAMGRRNRR